MRERMIARLRAAGCVFAEEEADLLIAEAQSASELERMLVARVEGEPLEYILGWAEFRGIRISVEPGVFVPRRRTEFLVECVLGVARADSVVVDLCCGAGAIGAAVSASMPSADVYAADIDPVAVRCARRNIRSDRVFEGDLFAPLPAALRGRVDVIAANAPYVPTDEIGMMPTEARDHEARTALDGGSDGLDLHRRIAASSRDWLTAGGYLLIETSARQAPMTTEILERVGFVAVAAHSDEFDATVVTGALKPP